LSYVFKNKPLLPQTRISPSFVSFMAFIFPPTEQSHAAAPPSGLFISLVGAG
jgi:hypothetical protein